MTIWHILSEILLRSVWFLLGKNNGTTMMQRETRNGKRRKLWRTSGRTIRNTLRIDREANQQTTFFFRLCARTNANLKRKTTSAQPRHKNSIKGQHSMRRVQDCSLSNHIIKIRRRNFQHSSLPPPDVLSKTHAADSTYQDQQPRSVLHQKSYTPGRKKILFYHPYAHFDV